MNLTINGGARTVAAGVTVAGLLEALGFPAGTVLVEHNGQALFPRELERVVLQDGDRLELVRIAAGG